jgi:hypothetical protein
VKALQLVKKFSLGFRGALEHERTSALSLLFCFGRMGLLLVWWGELVLPCKRNIKWRHNIG